MIAAPSRKIDLQDFDYWPWWTRLIKEHGLSPSEAWKMDIVEIQQLEDNKKESEQDASIMINAIRKMNGMSDELIKNRIAK